MVRIVRFSQSLNYSNSIIFLHTKVKLLMVLQSDVILNPKRFENHQSKWYLINWHKDIEMWGIYINTPLSDILYYISHSISPYIKTHLPAHCPNPCRLPPSQRNSRQSRNAVADAWGLDFDQKLPPSIKTRWTQHYFQNFSKITWRLLSKTTVNLQSRIASLAIGQWHTPCSTPCKY